MTPREALYHLVIELGPVPRTTRNDNLSPKEIRLRDSVETLKRLIDEVAESEGNVEAYRDKLISIYCDEASKH